MKTYFLIKRYHDNCVPRGIRLAKSDLKDRLIDELKQWLYSDSVSAEVYGICDNAIEAMEKDKSEGFDCGDFDWILVNVDELKERNDCVSLLNGLWNYSNGYFQDDEDLYPLFKEYGWIKE